MADPETFQEPKSGGPLRWVIIAVATVAVGWGLYMLVSMFMDVGGVKVQDAPPTVVDMLPPPPPPPPPPPEERPPEPQEQTESEPEPQPQPEQPAPAPMQIDGPAQAGSDAYGLAAGKGGGMGAPASTGPCVGPRCGAAPAGTDRFWGSGAARALERIIERSGKVNVDAFVSEYDIWVNASGEVTQVRLARSSGNGRLDADVQAVLNGARGLKPPPVSLRMPQRIKVGRKRV